MSLFIPWKYAYGPTLAMVLLAAASWIPYFLRTKPEVPIGTPYMTGFGENIPFDVSHPLLNVQTNGSYFSSYQKDYQVAAVAFRYYGNGDVKDTSALQKSGLYDIRNGSITIFIHPDEQFIQTMQRGETGTQYFLLLIPNKIQPSQFSTLRQAEALGVKIIAGGAGPP